jgi:hypothetical protein
MCPLQHAHILRRTFALILIPFVALGCYNWKTAAMTPQVLLETEHPKMVRLSLAQAIDTVHAGTDSAKLVVRGDRTQVIQEPRIAADTLRGLQDKDSVAVAVREITRVEVRRFDGRATAGALGLVGLAVFVGYLISACSDPENWAC